MKYKKRHKRLEERQKVWEQLSAQDKESMKKPGSLNRKKCG